MISPRTIANLSVALFQTDGKESDNGLLGFHVSRYCAPLKYICNGF